MHRVEDPLSRALLDVMSFINDPRQDWRMMAEAKLDLDPAFLPLLVRLGVDGPAPVVELAQRLGRDHSTVSRQITRLEAAGLVVRAASAADGRIRTAGVTPKGAKAVAALSMARRRLLDRALVGWTEDEREALGRLLGRFAQGLHALPPAPPKP